MAVTIYHNPRCSKSRQTLELLEEKGIKPEIIEYLLSPPSADELKNILNILGISARELMRKKEAAYQENGLDDGNLSEDELVDAIIKNPILIERPIVVSKGKAAIGRPPENVLAVI
jgi:arsenate reductase